MELATLTTNVHNCFFLFFCNLTSLLKTNPVHPTQSLESQNWRKPLQVCVSGLWWVHNKNELLYYVRMVQQSWQCLCKLLLQSFVRWRRSVLTSNWDCTAFQLQSLDIWGQLNPIQFQKKYIYIYIFEVLTIWHF